MKKELDEKLCAKYPLIFKDRNASMQSTAMCWGFECGDGWYNILDILCHHLSNDYNQAKSRYEYIKDRLGIGRWEGSKIIISQVEIDEARTKLDEETLKVPIATQVKEKFGGLRFYVSGASDEQYNYISFAESMSYRTCEECGAQGRLYTDGWHRTLCSVHAKQEGKEETDANLEHDVSSSDT